MRDTLLAATFGFALASTLAIAEDEDKGIGLSAGLELGAGNINKANDEDREPYLKPIIIYEKSFLDGTLDLSAELDYIFGFAKKPNDDLKKVNPQSLYFDLALGYNLSLGDASTLSFILENEFDEFIISPRLEESNNITGIFTPSIKFNQKTGLGDIYAQLGAPITYIQEDKDADAETELAVTVGWESSFDFSAEVETDIPMTQKINEAGVTVTPELAYSLSNFTIYVNCEFASIGVDGGKASLTPAVGVKYGF